MDDDVITVGARVAGSVLATLLGRKGHRVLLLEKA
jgi:flavin-dependent dehydrogenase